MSETPLTDTEALSLAGTTDADTDFEYHTVGQSTYYLDGFRQRHRALAILKVVNALRVYKDGDLTFGVRPGRYMDADTPVEYAGAAEQALTNNQTNYIYLAADGTLTVNTTGFPIPSVAPHIPLATIATAAGAYDLDDITDYRGRALFRVCGDQAAREMTVANNTGSQINAGQLLHVSGWNAAGGCYEVELADADTASKPAQLVADEDIADTATGVATDRYDLTGVDTAAAPVVGSPVYLSATPGGWTSVVPAGADQIDQVVGVVTVKDASTGAIRFATHLLGQPEQIGTSGLEDGTVTAPKLASGVQDAIPNLNIVGADDGDGTGSAGIQARDAANNNLAGRFRVRTWIADSEFGAPSAKTDFSVTTGTQLREVTADTDYEAVSDATGLAVMNIDLGGAGTVYVMAEVDGRVYSSGAIGITTP